jgi:hypothetical protein
MEQKGAVRGYEIIKLLQEQDTTFGTFTFSLFTVTAYFAEASLANNKELWWISAKSSLKPSNSMQVEN